MRLPAALLLASLLSAQQTDADRFEAALDLAVASIERLHPDPYWRHDRATWRRELASLRFRLDALTSAEFELELKRLVALLQDGHSGVWSFPRPAALPLRLRWFADGLFVLAAGEAHRDLLGRRILAVQGRAVEDVERLLLPVVCADNDADARRRIAVRLCDPQLLHAAGISARPDAATFTVGSPDGGDGEQVLVALPEVAGPLASVAPGGPLLRDEHEDRPWFVAAPEPATRYLRFRRVEEPEDGAFERFCAQVFAAIAGDPEVTRLVIDLRGNGGGSNYLLQPLIHGVLRSRLDRPGGLFVITDERTFSAAMNCATRLERETRALFVGAPTGARPNHFGDAESVPLPSTGHVLRCSTVRWLDSDPRDRRRWIAPDLPAPFTFADYRAGRDAALAAIAAYRHEPVEGFDGKQPVHHWYRATQSGAWPPAQTPAAEPPAPEEPPPGRATYMGRTIAQTMHWRGAEWLMRATRENEEHTERLFGALDLRPGLTICDLGCGNGYHTLTLAERVGPDGKVFAVDIQRQMLAMLKRRQEKRGLTNIELVHNTVADPRLPDRSCDLILLVDVYHEFSHPVLMLAGLRRALKPGGRLVLVEFRAEDPEVPIKKLHKMSKAQIGRELAANGFRLRGQFDELPWQHVMTFVPGRRP